MAGGPERPVRGPDSGWERKREVISFDSVVGLGGVTGEVGFVWTIKIVYGQCFKEGHSRQLRRTVAEEKLERR